MRRDSGSLFFLQALSSALIFQKPHRPSVKTAADKRKVSQVEDSDSGEHADGEQEEEAAADCFSSRTFDHAVISFT